MKKNILLFVCLTIGVLANAQIRENAELNQRLQGKTKFYDIKATVQNYFHEKKAGFSPADSILKKRMNRQAKFWNRFLYESESRLNSNDEVENEAQRIVNYLSTPQAADATTSAYGNWTFIGPNYVDGGIGRINRVAFDPNNSLTVYAGSAAGGLFKTINEGLSWQSVGSFIPSLGINGISVSADNSQEVYVLTGDGDAAGFTKQYGYIRYSVGVLKSTDGGTTWNRTASFPGLDGQQYVGYQLTQSTTNPNILIAATSKGMFRTVNGGNSWSICNLTGETGNDKMVWDVKFKPGSSTVVYCTFRANDNDGHSVVFARSTDGGISFSKSGITYNNAITNATRIVIGVTPANSNYVYLLCGPGYVTDDDDSNDTFEGLYRSTNSGVDFTRRSNSPDILCYQDIINQQANQATYDLALAVSTTNANTILAGGLVVWRSTNGGTDWDEIVDYYEDIDNSNYIHPDVHDLRYNPLNGKVWACTDGGTALSSDDGDNWARRYTGLGCTQFYHFEPVNEDGDLWGGTQDNGTMIRSGLTTTFDKFDGGDGYDVLTDAAPAGNFNDKYWVSNESIWADGTVDVNITPDESDNFFPNLAMSPTNEDIIYAGYDILFVSYSRGDNWAKIDIPGPGNLYVPGNWCVSACPTNRKRIYSAGRAALDKGLYRVDNLDDIIPDAVTNLTQALLDAGYPGTNTKITDIAVSSNTSARFWVTVGGFQASAKVFYSNNSGSSFTNITGTLPNLPVNTIVADDNDNVYIGTDIGVYYKGVNDADWTPFYNGLPRVPVSELEFLHLVGGATLLYAATYGRGIWSSDIFSNCVTNLTVSQHLQGQHFFQAGNINSTSLVDGVAGTNVFFRAATQVVLQPGIEIKSGAELKAYIRACNSGPVPFNAIIGDSLMTLSKNIAAARDYGFVHNIISQKNNAACEFNIFLAGNYTVRIYDALTGNYVSSMQASFLKGINKLDIKVDQVWGKNLRADLFYGETLVHYNDFEK